MTPRIRLTLRIAGTAALVTVVVLGLVAVRHAARSAHPFAPKGWYYSRFTVHAADGGKAPDAARAAVVQVELARLDALGVRHVRLHMTRQGFVLAVAPGTRSLLAALSDALPVVEFRPVLVVAQPAGRCAPGSSATILCGVDGFSYTVAPAEIHGEDILTAAVERPRGARGWTVVIGLTRQGSARFAAFTDRLAKQPAPRNRLATVVDGTVVSAPTVNTAITGGSLEIAGSYSKAEATRLAAPFQTVTAQVQVRHDPITDTPP